VQPSSCRVASLYLRHHHHHLLLLLLQPTQQQQQQAVVQPPTVVVGATAALAFHLVAALHHWTATRVQHWPTPLLGWALHRRRAWQPLLLLPGMMRRSHLCRRQQHQQATNRRLQMVWLLWQLLLVSLMAHHHQQLQQQLLVMARPPPPAHPCCLVPPRWQRSHRRSLNRPLSLDRMTYPPRQWLHRCRHLWLPGWAQQPLYWLLHVSACAGSRW
jgi:hypothetical protein